jgi:predicted acyltransferase
MLSLDALRGFDMFWLIGGQAVVLTIAAATEWPWLKAFADELEHPPWHGFQWWDLVMPLFMFVSGVTIPLAITQKLERGEPKRSLYWRIGRRLIVLLILNLILNGALRDLDWHQTRFLGVLTRIGLAYFFASAMVMSLSVRWQVVWAIGLLVGYWAAMMVIPVPGVGVGLLTKEGNLAGYIDRCLMPGQILGGIYDRLGLFSTIPAIVTVLLGALAGTWLRWPARRGGVKAIGLLAAGASLWALAQVLSPSVPFNTKFWSPTYVLVSAGWSMILLALFHQVIDVWGFRRWMLFFVVIGVNPITIYFGQSAVDFSFTTNFFFDGLLQHADPAWRPFWQAVCLLGVKWLPLYFLYRHKIFFRV